MGYAVAAEAARRGARVILVSGPSALEPPPAGVELVRVRSAARDARGGASRTPADADVVVMAAAVADYTPERRAAGEDREDRRAARADLVRTPDILAELGRGRGADARGRCWSASPPRAAIPWSAAAQKLRRKDVDLIVANDIPPPDAGFDSELNAVTLIVADGDETVAARPEDRAGGAHPRPRRAAARASRR